MNTITIEGKIVHNDGEVYGQVAINEDSGLIERVGRASRPADIKVPNSLIFPGFLDVHVHAREDRSRREVHKEDFRTMSEAAIHGGVVHVLDMPNNPVAPVNDDLYEGKKALLDSSLVDVTLYAGIGPNTDPLSFDVPYKVFMGPSVGDLFFTSKEQLEGALTKYEGRSVSFHCEDPEILAQNKSRDTWESQRPREAEIVAIDFALSLIKKYSLRGKICHCSTREGAEKIREAKRRGISVTCEVTPHHLYFDESILTEVNRVWFQVNPPLRTRRDRMALLGALKDGTIDYLASDHAPHTRLEKLEGVSGLPHLDTYGAFAAWLIKEHGFSPSDIARVCAFNPGQFVFPFLPEHSGKGFGRIEEGYIGSLTVMDPASPTTILRKELKTKCGWSPFEGTKFPGRVTHTIVRGKVYEA